MFFRKKYVLAAIESTYNTDPTPVAADAILTSNLSITPYDGNTVQRDNDREFFGNFESINTGPLVMLEFDVEVAGAGSAAVTAGTPPPYDVLMRACGYSSTSQAGTDTVYAPVSTAFESATLYFWLDGQQHIITGARGSMSMTFQREELPKWRFSIQGNYNSPTAQASASPDTTDFQDPLAVLDVSTSLTFFTQAVKTESVSIDLSNNVVPRFLINGDEIIITDRAPSGSIVFEAPDIGTYDFFGDMESHAGTTTGALQLIHGTVTGNIVQIDAPTCQLANIGIQDSDGIVAYNGEINLIPASGNDELTITVK